MKFLPIFYFPTTLVFVDDDRSMLDAYEECFAERFNCSVFKNLNEAYAFFDNYKSKITKLSLLELLEDIELENPEYQAAIQLDFSKILDIYRNRNKNQEVSVAILDCFIESENDGIALAKHLESHQFKKMLSTQDSDYEKATDELSNKTIDYFLNKFDPQNLDKKAPFKKLKKVIQDLATSYFIEITEEVKKHLRHSGVSAIFDPIFIEYFQGILQEKNIVEYYMIDKQGSYLLKSNNGIEYILIVHTDKSMQDFTGLLGEYEEFSEITKLINQKKSIPFLGIHKTILDIDISNIQDYIVQNPEKILGKSNYYVVLKELG